MKTNNKKLKCHDCIIQYAKYRFRGGTPYCGTCTAKLLFVDAFASGAVIRIKNENE
jgi:hypothetical protein